MHIIHAVFKELKEKEGIEKFAVAGYCFGGRITTLLASTDLVQLSIVAHPAALKVPDDIETIKAPTLWLCAEVDAAFPQDARKSAQEILEKKGVKNVFKDYPGTEHGFAVRGDEKSEHVKKAKIAALEEAIKFILQEI
jgi:carboxymethylenebutenolidase